MSSLDRSLRKQLEKTVRDARRVAEAGARQSIEQLAVHHHEPWSTLGPEQRKLRNRLRAHGRQLGDRLDEQKGTQPIDRLVGECAYEHWHRLLFARFLAENDLLVEPQSGMALSLAECRELARERGLDWLVLASDFAQRMLPQIFRAGDPVLEVTLPPEKRQELEALLEALPRDVFVADDSLGWVYQFWQAEQKDAVNKSEKKIGADELPAVTQLFTEDYMVLFLLHNTLGAWWAGKVIAARPELARAATSEEEIRQACALADVDWAYLRFTQDEDGAWHPATGAFDGWPKAASSIRALDPCMGSGHFLVFALPIFVSIRMAEEDLSRREACDAVLRDNLFGLEIDPRCTQIAAFNLAIAAWRMGGYRALPRLNLACSGLSVGAKEGEWLALAGDDERLRTGMKRLFDLFQNAPILGSLIDPRALSGDLLEAGFRDLAPLLEKAVATEQPDETAHEIAVTASGLAKAAEVLAGAFTLVVTNVPYLGRGRQDSVLRAHCEKRYLHAKADLAICFVERCLTFCTAAGSAVLVTPQSWLFLGTYKHIRKRLLQEAEWNAVARLGPHAFETIGGEVVNVALIALTQRITDEEHCFAGVDASDAARPGGKAELLRAADVSYVVQKGRSGDPDASIAFTRAHNDAHQLKHFATIYQGVSTTDRPRFVQFTWEQERVSPHWEWFHMAPKKVGVSDLCGLLRWGGGGAELANIGTASKGLRAQGRRGLAVAVVRSSYASQFLGNRFDGTLAVIIPNDDSYLAAIGSCVFSEEFASLVREVDQALSVTESSFGRIRFDTAHWRQVAAEKFPTGLPKPHSDDPTQWLFAGHPRSAEQPLQVAVGRLLGYRWPRQTGSSFMDCPALGPDGLERHSDEDGIVCLISLRGEASAADRLSALLVSAFRAEWSAPHLDALLRDAGFAGRALEDWLHSGFFNLHCALFHQRPFVWHIWDGLNSGFGALVNYHRLAAPNGEGRRTLEKLIYTYLGDWIDRQRADQKAGVEGADARVAAAVHLKRELEKILEGEPPYDIFVRWKPLHQQPVGWDPDVNDGVRINIRPFMAARPLNARGKNACILRVTPKIKWDKDRGKEPIRPKAEYPWFWSWDKQTKDFLGGTEFDGNRWNDLHYSRAAKLASRDRQKKGADV